jgi:hypothetical protein
LPIDNEQLGVFLARRAIELNCFDVPSGALKQRLNCIISAAAAYHNRGLILPALGVLRL